jgi:O-antigen/teichoic acid export membrane protein
MDLLKTKSVGRNVVLSTLGSLTNHVVRAGQQLLWVPLFLAAFGKEGYGEWLTVFGLAGYVSMADLGVQVYWLNLLTGAHVRGEIGSYRRIFRAGLMLFAVVGGLALVTGLVFSVFRGPSRVLNLEIIGDSTASMVFLVLVVSTLLSVLSQMLRGVFRTIGENPKFVLFEIIRELLIFVLIAVALLIGLGPMGLALVYGGSAVFMLFWVVFTMRGRFSDLLDFGVHRADRATVNGLMSGGSMRMASLLANLLLVQGTLIITNWALGTAAVALIATIRTLTNVASQAGGSVYVATLPEFSRMDAAGDGATMERLLHRSMAYILLISGIVCILLVGLGPWLFEIWTGGRFPDATPLIYLFVASVVVDALRMPLNYFLLGCNRITWVSVTDITYAVSSLTLMWLLFPSLKAWSVPLATISCGVLVHLPSVLFCSTRILGFGFLWRLLPMMGMGVALVALSAVPLGLGSLAGSSVTFLAVQTAIVCVVFGVLSWLLVLDRADSALLKEWVRRLVAR